VHAIVSIHDVAPATLSRVEAIIERLPPQCRKNLLLLVIPGVAWSSSDLETLRHWQASGFILVGHGWQHHCESIKSLYHRAHSLLLSRRAAEHLSHNRHQICALLKRNHDWFSDSGLLPPDFYVPPAWALGDVDKKTLQSSPFRYFETTSGLYDAKHNRWQRLPLVGFEADTLVRAASLGVWNRFNEALCSKSKPLRISIHPYDPELKLKTSLRQLLSRVVEARHYSGCFQ